MPLTLILHNIRSAHNIGAMFRTADGAGVETLVLTGYTMVPAKNDATLLTRAEKDLAKTALGAEKTMSWKQREELGDAIQMLRAEGYEIVALEQSDRSVPYDEYVPLVRCAESHDNNREGKVVCEDVVNNPLEPKVALLVGTEVTGLNEQELSFVDTIVEIPMKGQKESLNVSVATGIALYAIMKAIRR